MTLYELRLSAEGAAADSAGHSEAAVHEAALRTLRQAVHHEPTDSDFSYILGMALARSGRLDEARTALLEACAGNPNEPSYRRALGECEWRRGRFDSAADAFREVLARHPEDEAANGLALSLLAGGQPGQAVEALRPALSRNPSRADWLSNLGAALAEAGQPEEAERSFKRAVRLAPDEPAFKRNLARLLLGLGRAAEAVGWLRRALEQAPGHAPSWISLGDAHFAVGERGQAEAAYGKGLALDPLAMTGRPDSLQTWSALRVWAARQELEGTKDRTRGPNLWHIALAFGRRLDPFAAVFGRTWSERMLGVVVAVFLVLLGRAAVVVWPHYVGYHRLRDDVAHASRLPTKDDSLVRADLAAVITRHGYQHLVSADQARVSSRGRYRRVELDYGVPVDVVPWVTSTLRFHIRVEELFLLEPDPVFQ